VSPATPFKKEIESAVLVVFSLFAAYPVVGGASWPPLEVEAALTREEIAEGTEKDGSESWEEKKSREEKTASKRRRTAFNRMSFSSPLLLLRPSKLKKQVASRTRDVVNREKGERR
jgi:hypothetical protein